MTDDESVNFESSDWSDSLDDADSESYEDLFHYEPKEEDEPEDNFELERDQPINCENANPGHCGQCEPDYDDPFSHLYYIPEYNFYISKHCQSNELIIVVIQTGKDWDAYNITRQSFECYDFKNVPDVCSGNYVTDEDIRLCVAAYLDEIKTHSYDSGERTTDHDGTLDDTDIPF